MDRTHPEGIAFEPEGHGFTTEVKPFGLDTRPTLLYENNIRAVEHNHPDAWLAAFESLPKPTRDPRTGRRTGGFTEDERRRLATLAILVDHGMYADDRREAPKKEVT